MSSSNRTILIVDDSVLIVKRLVNILRKAGYKGQILQAQAYEEALLILSSSKIDIALFDIRLPGKSGIDLLRTVTWSYPGVFVIMLTNQSDVETRTACLKIGARYFLDKSKDFTQIPKLIAILF